MEHLVPRVEQVDVQEAVGLVDRLLVDGVQLALGQQSGELLQQAVLLQLVAQAPDHEELGVDADGVADEPQLLGRDPGRDLEPAQDHQPAAEDHGGQQAAQNAAAVPDPGRDRRLRRFAAPAQEDGRRSVLEVDLLAIHGDLHGLLDVLLDRPPAVVHVDAGGKPGSCL